MEVFLSWSGERSHGVARAFYGWLPHVIQDIQPFFSTDSISKGEAWLTRIREGLAASNGVGLFFLTPEALSSSWLMFEAGGIAALDKQRVCTICIDLAPRELEPPLSFFQATQLVREDIFKLVSDLNKNLPKPLGAEVLEKSFERTWPDLEAQLQALTASAPKKEAETKKAPPHPVSQDLAPVMDALRRIEARLGTLEQQQHVVVHPDLAARNYLRSYTPLGSPEVLLRGLGAAPADGILFKAANEAKDSQGGK